jgi:hypothetical protein
MTLINWNDLFDRKHVKELILDFLSSFSPSNLTQTKGLYIIGPSGCGKTAFINDIIPKGDYDIISYDASDIRTKAVIPDLVGSKLSNCNVLNLFSKKRKQTVIIMDEMDYMNVGDKGGIKELIKYTRPKKTKKQQVEPQTICPIIFIGNNDNDKKIKELINVCTLLKLQNPTDKQMVDYIKLTMPNLINTPYLDNLLTYSNNNLRKLDLFIEFYNYEPTKINLVLDMIVGKNNFYTHTKEIVRQLYTNYIPISNYNSVIKETDRTTLGLLWHENMSSIINTKQNLSVYKQMLDNLCVSDYIDRIIFQNQIWQLSEQNSFIKTFYNNYLLHQHIKKIKIPDEIIFTKVLTKYSTEYNNYCFLQQLEQKLFCNKNEIIHQFINKTDEELENKYYLSTLDIERMKRFIMNGEFTCA